MVKLGENLSLDVTKLIETRLLVQTNAGGGKSHFLRKLLEITFGKVQHIVFDIEGEFSSLREKYDYILAGKGGDIPANPKTAALLARKILELQSSIIIDLYELKYSDRILFVKNFLESMIDAPKNLWHPVIVGIDEAHIYAPEKGNSEALGAVVDLLARGRKRGYCAVLATQRLSKLHKDAAAECNNKLIGRTGLDIDIKRAADELGMSTKDASVLRTLEPGEFFAYGPAISKTVVRGKIGPVETKHPKAGSRGIAHAPAATSKVKSVLAKLADLPAEVEKEENDKASLMSRVRMLESELREAKKSVKVETKVEKVIDPKAIERAVEDYKKSVNSKLKTAQATFLKEVSAVFDSSSVQKAVIIENLGTKPIHLTERFVVPRPLGAPPIPDLNSGIGRSAKKILKFLAMREGRSFSKSQIGAMTGFKSSGGSFNTYMSELRSKGLVGKNGQDSFTLTNRALAIKILGNEYLAPDKNSLEQWLEKLGGGAKNIYKVLYSAPNSFFTKEELGARAGMESSGGSFNTYISNLNSLGLIKKENGLIGFNQELLGM